MWRRQYGKAKWKERRAFCVERADETARSTAADFSIHYKAQDNFMVRNIICECVGLRVAELPSEFNEVWVPLHIIQVRLYGSRSRRVYGAADGRSSYAGGRVFMVYAIGISTVSCARQRENYCGRRRRGRKEK